MKKHGSEVAQENADTARKQCWCIERPNDNGNCPVHGTKDRDEPQPGEVWVHESQGKVKIVRKWNERESVCELVEQKNRRALLMNCLMKYESQ